MALMEKQVTLVARLKASFWAFRPRPINHGIIKVNNIEKELLATLRYSRGWENYFYNPGHKTEVAPTTSCNNSNAFTLRIKKETVFLHVLTFTGDFQYNVSSTTWRTLSRTPRPLYHQVFDIRPLLPPLNGIIWRS